VHAEHNLYTCSQDSIVHITEQVKALDLNRVVVASCTPITHEPLFRDSIRMAGLNPFLFEMANIRNHCSWVHSDNREVATEKAKALVRMAVARANLLLPQPTREMPIEKSALVIGGGVAGMNAALSLADQGFPVHLIERSAQLGGNLRNIHYLADYGSRLTGSRDPQLYLASLTELVSQHPLIELYLDTELEQLGGFVGKFSSRLRRTSRGVTEILDVNHGAVIVATGAREYRGPEYGYGQHRAVATQQEFEALLADSSAELPQSIAMIQCIGPAEQYCSRTCCTVALKNALRFKDRRPDGRVVVLYKDIRTFGFKERLYTEARRRGVLFVRYDDNHKPAVSFQDDAPDIIVWEPLVERELRLRPDLLVLSMPQVPAEGTTALVSKLRVSVDLDGWFMEAHVKLRPVDFSSEGIFVAGAAHYPKFLDETIVQAEAAASRAANILANDTRTVGGQVAVVDTEKCVGCLTCVRICPFDVPEIRADLVGVGRLNGAATIEPAMCQGCGSCVAECPAKAISLMHYTDLQMLAKVDALFDLLPREAITVV
jgi:heterodisulfide reductase subunit A